MKYHFAFALLLSVGLVLFITLVLPPEIIAFIPLAIWIIATEVVRKKENGWDYLTLFNAIFFLCYILAPILLIMYPDRVRHYVAVDTHTFYYPIVIVYLSYITFVLSYLYFGKEKNVVSGKEQIYSKYSEKTQRYVYFFGWAFMLLGIVSFLFYAQIYGGIIGLYRQSSNIRAGITASSNFLFLNSLNSFIIISSWLFASYYYFQKKRSNRALLLCVVSVVLTIAIVFSKAARLSLAFGIVPILFAPYILKHKKPSKLLMVLFFAVFVIWTAYGKQIFNSITYDINITSAASTPIDYLFLFIGEFVHPFISLQLATASVPNVVHLRYLSDIWDSLIVILPKQLIGIEMPPSVSFYNTYLTKGTFVSEVPPGFVGYFFYSFKIAGVILGSAILGFLVGNIEKWLIKLREHHPIYVYYYIGIGFTLMYFVMQGDPRVLSQSYYYVFLSIFIIRWNLNISSKSIKQNDLPFKKLYLQKASSK